MWNRSLYAIDAKCPVVCSTASKLTRQSVSVRVYCDAARRDGAELAAAALDVARVADERLAAALAAADVGAVHACTPSTRQRVRCRGGSRRWRAGGKCYVRERYMVRRRPEGEVAVRTPKGTDDVVAALVAAAERGREAVTHPARRDGLLGRLQRRQCERWNGVGGRPLALASRPGRRDDGRRRLRGLALGRAEHGRELRLAVEHGCGTSCVECVRSYQKLGLRACFLQGCQLLARVLDRVVLFATR